MPEELPRDERADFAEGPSSEPVPEETRFLLPEKQFHFP